MEWRKSYLDLLLVPTGLLINLAYHCWLLHQVRNRPMSTIIGINAVARRMWVAAMMKDNDKKNILAVQTLRNSIMGSTLMATTSILLCTGLAAVISSTYSIKKPVGDAVYGAHGEVMVALKYVALLLLFLFTFLCHTLSIRFVNQVNFLINTPADPSFVITVDYVCQLLEKGCILNTVGNRLFYVALPLLLWIFGPVMVFLCSVTIVPILYNLDVVFVEVPRKCDTWMHVVAAVWAGLLLRGTGFGVDYKTNQDNFRCTVHVATRRVSLLRLLGIGTPAMFVPWSFALGLVPVQAQRQVRPSTGAWVGRQESPGRGPVAVAEGSLTISDDHGNVVRVDKGKASAVADTIVPTTNYACLLNPHPFHSTNFCCTHRQLNFSLLFKGQNPSVVGREMARSSWPSDKEVTCRCSEFYFSLIRFCFSFFLFSEFVEIEMLGINDSRMFVLGQSLVLVFPGEFAVTEEGFELAASLMDELEMVFWCFSLAHFLTVLAHFLTILSSMNAYHCCIDRQMSRRGDNNFIEPDLKIQVWTSSSFEVLGECDFITSNGGRARTLLFTDSAFSVILMSHLVGTSKSQLFGLDSMLLKRIMVCSSVGVMATHARVRHTFVEWLKKRPIVCIIELHDIKEIVAGLSKQSPKNVKVVLSPYRICPLGAHIDHQGGTVSAMTINRGILLGFVPSDDAQVVLKSAQFDGDVRFSVDDELKPKDTENAKKRDWGDYARGAVYALKEKGFKITKSMVIFGPPGSSIAKSVFRMPQLHKQGIGIMGFVLGCRGLDSSGLSSSAATLQLSAKNDRIDKPLKPFPSKHLCTFLQIFTMKSSGLRKFEEGVDLGAMIRVTTFQLATIGHGFESRDKSHEHILLGGQECKGQEAYKILLAFSGVNLEPAVFEAQKANLERNLSKRAEHYFSESKRVAEGCEEQKQLWEILQRAPGVYGARFSGAGFGGCCIAFVETERAVEAASFVRDEYCKVQPDLASKLGSEGAVLICEAGDCARIL
ncbi:hypothetical protein ACLOJK_030853 [Asimina triloba]